MASPPSKGLTFRAEVECRLPEIRNVAHRSDAASLFDQTPFHRSNERSAAEFILPRLREFFILTTFEPR
jgi:hypothetical protein